METKKGRIDIETKIVSYERVREIYEKNEKPIPYVIDKIKDKQELIFIGLNHSYNINNPQFKKVKDLWTKFIKNARKPLIVLVEGGEPSLEETEERAIAQHGESGLMTYLAHQENIEVTSPEPPRKPEADKLAEEFGSDQVMLYYFLRQIPQWHRITGTRPSVEEYMQSTLDSYSKRLGWEKYDFSYKHFLDVYQITFGASFDPQDRDQAHQLCDPTMSEYVTNQVSRASGRHRDIYIAEQIIKYWEEGKSIFATYGSAHAYTLEPVLSNL